MVQTKKKLLVVEDEVSLLNALIDMFTQEGLNVVQAKDGKTGLELAQKEHPDLILLDILLPKMSGLEVLERLRKDDWGKNAKVILLTNLSDTRTLAYALSYDVHTYLVKSDLDVDFLIKKVKEYLKIK